MGTSAAQFLCDFFLGARVMLLLVVFLCIFSLRHEVEATHRECRPDIHGGVSIFLGRRGLACGRCFGALCPQ